MLKHSHPFQFSDSTEVFLRRSEVESLTALSCSGIYARMSKGEFPKPLSIGGNSVRWRLSDVRAWMESCEKQNAGQT